VQYLLTLLRSKVFKGFIAQGLRSSYDPLADESPHPTIFTPRGSDGSSTHAVCKVYSPPHIAIPCSLTSNDLIVAFVPSHTVTSALTPSCSPTPLIVHARR
jgi:hypothetical protein